MWSGEGGLTDDPKYNEEIGLVTFSLAIDNAGRNDKQTDTGYFNVTAWTKPNKMSPDAVGEYLVKAVSDGLLAKGARVKVVGRLSHERFTRADGSKGSDVKVIADNVIVVWNKDKMQKRSADSGSTSSSDSSSTDAPAAAENDNYEATPF